MEGEGSPAGEEIVTKAQSIIGQVGDYTLGYGHCNERGDCFFSVFRNGPKNKIHAGTLEIYKSGEICFDENL